MNEKVSDWEPLFECKGRAYPLPGVEKEVASGVRAEAQVVFEVRPTTKTLAVKPSDRIRMNGEAYGITAITQPERGKDIRILTQAGKDD